MTTAADMIASPCTNVCRIDSATGWCEGCQRTLDEIAAWASLPSGDKQAVLQRVAERRIALQRSRTEPQR